jgi:hypothetical protein
MTDRDQLARMLLVAQHGSNPLGQPTMPYDDQRQYRHQFQGLDFFPVPPGWLPPDQQTAPPPPNPNAIRRRPVPNIERPAPPFTREVVT